MFAGAPTRRSSIRCSTGREFRSVYEKYARIADHPDGPATTRTATRTFFYLILRCIVIVFGGWFDTHTSWRNGGLDTIGGFI